MLPSAVASEEQEEANVASSTEKTSMPWGVPDAASSTHSASAQPAASQGGDGGYVHGICCNWRVVACVRHIQNCCACGAAYMTLLMWGVCRVLWMRTCVLEHSLTSELF